jgi:dTMP kinase
MKRPRHPSGLFITFEGSDGCGKSTQIRRLAAHLRRLGHRVMVTREPGGTPVGERIRHLLKFSKSGHAMTPEAELLLFSASRAQLVREKILPALALGEVVLCDRFADSTTVYQGVGRKLDAACVAHLNDFAIAARKPDLTLVLDLDVATGLARAQRKTRTRDRMESQRRSFYQAVRRGFQALARREPRRVKLIDASRSVDEVAHAIWHIVKPRISERRTEGLSHR